MTAPVPVLPPPVAGAREVERLTLVTAFGLSLWDPVVGRPVSDGLTVRVHALGTPPPAPPAPAGALRLLAAVEARPNRSGVFVARGLPGLRAFEEPPAGVDPWAAPPAPRPFLAEVRDPAGRYGDFALRLALPAPRGLVRAPCGDALWPADAGPPSPPDGPAAGPPARIPLLPAPAYPVPPGMAAVRATLLDAATRAPAAGAVLEVRHLGRLLGRAVADARGEVLAVLAYPEPDPPPPLSPPASPPVPPPPVAWPLAVAVRWRRDLPRHATDAARPALAELCALLVQPVVPVRVATAPPAPLGAVTLHPGEDLVLGAPHALLVGPP